MLCHMCGVTARMQMKTKANYFTGFLNAFPGEKKTALPGERLGFSFLSLTNMQLD